jgi:hypothetical protein
MSNRSRRSVLEQIGLVLGASVGVGSVRAFDDGDAYDALEEMRDVLLDLERELSRAEDQLEDLDNASGFGGFDDPDFGGIDGDDPPAEILDDVGDDVVINDIPVSRMVPLNGTNNTDAREFDRTVRVNGVKVGIAKNGTQASESGTRDPPRAPRVTLSTAAHVARSLDSTEETMEMGQTRPTSAVSTRRQTPTTVTSRLPHRGAVDPPTTLSKKESRY